MQSFEKQINSRIAQRVKKACVIDDFMLKCTCSKFTAEGKEMAQIVSEYMMQKHKAVTSHFTTQLAKELGLDVEFERCQINKGVYYTVPAQSKEGNKILPDAIGLRFLFRRAEEGFDATEFSIVLDNTALRKMESSECAYIERDTFLEFVKYVTALGKIAQQDRWTSRYEDYGRILCLTNAPYIRYSEEEEQVYADTSAFVEELREIIEQLIQ